MGTTVPPLSRAAGYEQSTSCYTSGRVGWRSAGNKGGGAIAEVLRRAWSCLIQRRWLFFYPLAASIVSVLSFFAVYVAQNGSLSWSSFFVSYHDRVQFLHDQFIADFSLTSQLWTPIAAGIGFCLISSLIQAPFFRAVVGHRYPLAPRTWREVTRLFGFYLVLSLFTQVAPLAVLGTDVLGLVATIVIVAIGISVVFADYVIIFEDIGPIGAVRRSLRLVRLRAPAVIAVIAVVWVLYWLIMWGYGLYYKPGKEVFFLLPVSQILVETLVSLFATTVLVFMYEDLRKQSPARAKA
jgi:hypothetical protein